MKLFTFVLFFCVLVACSGRPPFLEYTLARSALGAAQKVSSEVNAPTYWIKAMKYYYKGEESFRNRNYVASAQFFDESLKWSEKAENLSRFRINTGDDL